MAQIEFTQEELEMLSRCMVHIHRDLAARSVEQAQEAVRIRRSIRRKIADARGRE